MNLRFQNPHVLCLLLGGLVLLWGCKSDNTIEPIAATDTLSGDGESLADIEEVEDVEVVSTKCSTNKDCDDLEPDSSGCSAWICSSSDGVCLEVAKSDYAGCINDDLCTQDSYCLEGECFSNSTIQCDDNNLCTDDSCESTLGCVYEANAQECDDENACTTIDNCSDGLCVGTANICICSEDEDCLSVNDDNLCNGSLHCDEDSHCVLDPSTIVFCPPSENACTLSICKPITGLCETSDNENGILCDDDDACTLGDNCLFGVCTPTSLEECTDGDPLCLFGDCVPDTGCAYISLEGECDDDNPCTETDACEDGLCVGGINSCACQFTADCLGSEDENLCNGTLTCENNNCVIDPESVVVCDASANTLCSSQKCESALGECAPTPINEGLDCNDTSACTQEEICLAGSCGNGVAINCDDQNSCTFDSCDPLSGCIYIHSENPCDDGDECTGDDICGNGECTGTLIEACGDTCTGAEDCEDNNPCTGDSCNGFGFCVHNAIEECGCDNALDCNDLNECTHDICSSQSFCLHDSKLGSCDDGNPCSVSDFCLESSCTAGDPMNCEDNNQCTATYCEGGGCKTVFIFSPCEDDNACSINDICQGGSCLPGENMSCDDLNPCTVDSCSPTLGCLHDTTDGANCSPSNSCGLEGICHSSICHVVGTDGSCCTEDVQCISAASCVQGKCLGSGTCSYYPTLCLEEDSCSVAYCSDDECKTSLPLAANELFQIYEENFDSGTSKGWSFTQSNEDIQWAPTNSVGLLGTFGLYLGNQSTFSYDHGSSSTVALSPPIRIPENGGQFSFQVLKDVEDPNCPLDTLYVSVEVLGEAEATLLHSICGSSSNFDAYTLSLDAFAGEDIRLEFLFETGGSSNNSGLGVVLDQLEIWARAPEECCQAGPECDDGNPCTNDSCSGSNDLCVHEVCGAQTPCSEPGCAQSPCSGDTCCFLDSDCDDSFLCTTNQCVLGTCLFSPILCEDTSPCLVDFCFLAECLESGPSAPVQGQSIFFETFDDGIANGWSFSTDSQSASWSLQTLETASSPLALYGGNPEAFDYNGGNMAIVAKTPMISLPNDTILLRANVWADLVDSVCDKDVLQVYITSSNPQIQTTVLTPKICSGTKGKYTPWELDLSAFAGNPIQIAFSFATNGAQGNNGIGVFLDDINLLAFPSPSCTDN